MATTPTLNQIQDILLYGKGISLTDFIPTVALHSEKNNFSLANAPSYAPQNGLREVTKSVTLHYTGGWKGSGTTLGWNSVSYVATPYVIDIDGTVYQYTNKDAWTRHNKNKGPFSSQTNYRFSDDTSVGIEIAKFGPGKKNGATDNKITVNGTSIDFTKFNATNFPNATQDGKYSYTGTNININLDKIPGGVVYKRPNANSNSFFKLKAFRFNDDRNYDKSSFDYDALYPEEQMRSVVFLVKALCEHYAIPKLYLTNPSTGKEFPWIDVNDLVQNSKSAAIQIENKEKVLAFQGIHGHSSTHNDRMDPGPSMDYYRLKRGLSDEWWYPVVKDNSARPLDFLVSGNDVADYTAMPHFGELKDLEEYYKLNENADGGFFPIGANKIWHGGIHIPAAEDQKVYAASNGTVVAARVVTKIENLNYSQCFVLIKHNVHHKADAATADKIDYGQDSAGVFYSLYMHINPFVITKTNNVFLFDHATLPLWLNHYIIDNSAEAALESGDIIYPNVPVTLGDAIGTAGAYITSKTKDETTYGHNIHFEIFSKDIAPSDMAAENPWHEEANQIEDTTADAKVSSHEKVKQYILDSNNDGIDTIDIKNAAPGMRKVAVKHRSEWTIDDPAQLTDTVIIQGKPYDLNKVIKNGVDDPIWKNDIEPLMFYNELSDAVKEEVFGADKMVWQYHPFTFLEWMNGRAQKHESILVNQEKTRSAANKTSTVQTEGDYVDEFVSAVNTTTTTTAKYNEQDYEVALTDLADPASMANAASTTATKFHRHLLELLDYLNDTETFDILETYIAQGSNSTCGRAELVAIHKNGDCVDMIPSAVTLKGFYNLYAAIQKAIEYIKNKLSTDFEIALSYNSASTVAVADLLAAIESVNFTMQTATGPTDVALDAVVPHIAELRFHIGKSFDAMNANKKLALKDTALVDASDTPLTENSLFLLPFQLGKIKTTLEGVHPDTDVLFEFIGKHIDNGKHAVTPGIVDSHLMTVKKLWTGPSTDGVGSLIADFKTPEVPTHLQGKLKNITILSKIEKGAQSSTGKISSSAVIDTCEHEIKLPYFEGLYWSFDSHSIKPITDKYTDGADVWLFIKYGQLSKPVTATITITGKSGELQKDTVTLDAAATEYVYKWKTPDQGFLDFFKKDTVSAEVTATVPDYDWDVVFTSRKLVID